MKNTVSTWICCLCFALSISVFTYAQSDMPAVFTPGYFEKDGKPFGIISLSPLLPAPEESEEPQRLFSQLTSNDTATLESVKYIELSADSRRQLLQSAGLSENDHLYVFDVKVRRAFVVPVELLKAIAVLNDYVNELPVSESDYYIGFELDDDVMPNYIAWTWLSFGKVDPFEKRGLKNIRWTACNPVDFPSVQLPADYYPFYDDKPVKPADCFHYAHGNRNFYLRNYIVGDMVVAKHVVVTDKKSGKSIFENVYELCENCSFAPDNEQYTGKLLKGVPEVIFGFVYPAYWCPAISVLDQSGSEIPVLCDNRN